MYGGAAAAKARQLGGASAASKQPSQRDEASVNVQDEAELESLDGSDGESHFVPASKGKGRLGRQVSFSPSKVVTRKSGR
jgi:hypothetical protein